MTVASPDTLQLLALAAALGWASGFRAFLVLFVVGMAGLAGWVHLPAGLQVLANPVAVGITGVLAFAEFVGDKIPGVDSLLDFISTLLRIPLGALLAASVFGLDHGLVAALAAAAGGSLAAVSHGTKLATRAAINTSPEPFSNIGASFGEDTLVLGGLWLSWSHPLLFFVALVLALIAMVWLARRSLRFVRGLLARLVRLFSGRPEPGPPATPPAVPTSRALPDRHDVTDVQPLDPKA
ncbi:DUF4126 domain-containing protein [Thiomonas sp. FB-Cd]|uniref:DUF4126 domain-containing protein n=1 Tax=Thiomonas sp. FB-Cd TaxID=1158292 RepID=UPI0009DFE3BF|nr:DUF4126 domain-containing protein [Thiomonas sp. FB-Cd]